ncbi:hypothetical protein O6H91_02G109700 [Diphasiastrum complanatum]|nr:hypothetical protein O6H91_02G109700 [Diphasiastrum complanatum]
MQVLPNCSHLLNQEIVRLTSMVGQSSFSDHDGFERESLLSPASMLSNGGALELNGWASLQPERSALAQTTSLSWNGATGGVAVPVIKKTLKIEVPVDKYPNFNFVGRLLGPRGNTLKRVEQSSGCRVMIRGRGSIKDTAKEEKMRDKLGHEHLYEPLHVLVEAELPASIIDTHLKYAREILQEVLKPPMDDSMDVVKKAQLRELAILNGTLREESPGLLTGTTSPFNNPGMKRPKTRQ